jgi:nucleoside diphosphate kinase
MSVNQAVVFTKPVHHLGTDLTPSILDERTRSFFEDKGFNIVLSKSVTGSELAERDVIKQHYLMYSKASCSSSISGLNVSADGMAAFESAYGNRWDHEVATGRIITTSQLLKSKGINVHLLYDLWSEQFTSRKTVKIQDGIIMAYLEELDCFCFNAFYPAMEENFNHPSTHIDYYVLEFDPETVSWEQFRKKILGSTDASKADPDSLRGILYSEYPVDFPGRDNFVHGSAGPLEGFVERAIHEPDFSAGHNPIGRYLAERDLSLDEFMAWKNDLPITELGELFDATEEKNTNDVIPILDKVDFGAPV